jgi:hypothetical protein
MKRTTWVPLMLLTLSVLASSADAAPTPRATMDRVVKAQGAAYKALGVKHGQLRRATLRTMRLNPFLRTSLTDPKRVAKRYSNAASLQTGRALRAFMVGRQATGLWRQNHAQYLQGIAEGLTGGAKKTPTPPATPTPTR